MPAITQNDFLNPLFSLNPVLVALIIWIAGWGSLFLFALRTNSLSSFLKHPGFMFGDFLMLPLAGFLITLFYQQITTPVSSVTSKNWTYITAIIALFLTALSAYRTLFVWKTAPADIFLAPHLIFYFLFLYALINFLSKGLLQLLPNSTSFLWILYLGVIVAISTHLTLPLIFGQKTFPVT